MLRLFVCPQQVLHPSIQLVCLFVLFVLFVCLQARALLAAALLCHVKGQRLNGLGYYGFLCLCVSAVLLAAFV